MLRFARPMGLFPNAFIRCHYQDSAFLIFDIIIWRAPRETVVGFAESGGAATNIGSFYQESYPKRWASRGASPSTSQHYGITAVDFTRGLSTRH